MFHSRTKRSLGPLVAFVVVAFCTASAFAELPMARVTALFPPGGRVGSTVDVSVSGLDLDGATELRFSRAGLTASKSDDPSTQIEAKFKVSIGKNVPPGTYEARLVGRFGISNARAFVVGDRPELEHSASGNASDTAPQPLPVGTTVNARCTANSPDDYTLDLKQGQRVLLECATREIDARITPIILALDASGHEIDRSRRGGLLDFTAPHDGTYTIRVHDLLFRGGADYFYRLTASTAPHLDSIFPPVGQPGTKGHFTLYGRMLPGGKPSPLRGADGKSLEQLEVEIALPPEASAHPPTEPAAPLPPPSGIAADGIDYQLPSDKGVSNPMRIGLARAPVVLEQEPNDKPEQAQKLTVPCEYVGRFYPRGDADSVTFDADKGEIFWIEVVSERLGLPTSPEVLVQKVTKNDKGEEQASDPQELSSSDGKDAGGPAFRMATRDSGGKFTAKEAATYRITLRDLFNTADDNGSRVYRLSIRKPEPDFRLIAMPIASTSAGGNSQSETAITSTILRRGATGILRVVLLRMDGFDEPVQIEVQDLPKGVHCSGTTIPANDNAGTLFLTADDDAAAWTGTVKVTGSAKVGDAQRSRDAYPAEVAFGYVSGGGGGNLTDPPYTRLTTDLALAVDGQDREPIALRAGADTYESPAVGTLKIPIKIVRRGDGKPALRIRPVGLTGVSNNKEMKVDAGSDAQSLELEVPMQKLKPGTYTFAFVAQASVKYTGERADAGDGKKAGKQKGQGPKETPSTFYSPSITLTVTPAPEKSSKNK